MGLLPRSSGRFGKIQQHSINHPTTFAMYGGLAALTGDQGSVEVMRKEFQRRRDYLVQELLLMGLEVAPADGAFYAFVNTGGDDIGTARRWLEKAHVAVTPGSAFNTPGWQVILCNIHGPSRGGVLGSEPQVTLKKF
jgi:aspartate aminotransferase